jgi:hypothetical protein
VTAFVLLSKLLCKSELFKSEFKRAQERGERLATQKRSQNIYTSKTIGKVAQLSERRERAREREREITRVWVCRVLLA